MTYRLLAILLILSSFSCQSIKDSMNFKVDDTPINVRRPVSSTKKTDEENDQNNALTSETKLANNDQQSSLTLEGFPESTLILEPQNTFDQTGEFKLAFENLPLKEFIHQVFGDMLNVNYVLDPVFGDPKKTFPTVSLNFKNSLNKKQLYEIVQDTLNQNNFRIHAREQTYYIEYSKKQVTKTVTVAYGKNLSDIPITSGSIVQIVPLSFVDKTTLARMVKDLSGIQITTTNNNTAIIKGYKNEVEKILKMVHFFDKPSALARHIQLIRLTYIPMEEFETEISTLLEKEGISIDKSPISFTKIPYLNALIIHSRDQALINRTLYWAKILDVPVIGEEKQYFIYKPKYRDATSLSESFERLISLKDGLSATQTSSPANGGPANQTPSTQQPQVRPNLPATQSNSTASTPASVASDTLSMVADLQQNALIFYTTPIEYKKILPVLQQMDQLTPQVMIEASIIEVTLIDQFAQGVEWFLKKGGYSIGTLGNLGLSSGSLNYNVVGDSGDFIGTISLLESKNLVNILSNPRVVMSAGETANINIGTEIPILQSEAGALDPDSNQTVQSVTYRSTGVTLDVTATITGQDIASLQIAQTVSEAGENTISSLDSPTILNRSVSTSVLARDNQTIILGGLISENKSKKKNNVPWLGDIPWLGSLFESHSTSTTKTELIILLTPRIIHSSAHFDQLESIFQEDYKILKFERSRENEPIKKSEK